MKIISALLLLMIAGCNLGHGPFRTDFSFNPEVGECTSFSTPRSSKLAISQDICANGKEGLLSFAVIEFKDNGTYWNSKQLENVLREIERISRGQLRGKRGEAILLVQYIHGWRHNASENSSDLDNFRKFARDLATSPSVCNTEFNGGSTCPPEHKPHVLAVYLGWRGDPTGIAAGLLSRSPLRHPIQLPTFWNRKRTAREVASVAMTETLLTTLSCVDAADRWRRDVVNAAVQPDATTDEEDVHDKLKELPCAQWYSGESTSPSDSDDELLDAIRSAHQSSPKSGFFSKSRKILIGHSFGARALELAVAQAYLGDRAQSLQLYKRYFGKDGIETVKLKDLQEQLEYAREDASSTVADINELNEKKQHLEYTVGKLQNRKKEAHDSLKASQNSLRTATTVLETWPYSHRDRKTALRPCEKYDRDTVEKCAEKSSDANGSTKLKSIACAVDQIQCLNDTYLCAIERAFKDSEDRIKDVKLQDALACNVEADRSTPLSCQNGDGGDIGLTVSETLKRFEDKDTSGEDENASDNGKDLREVVKGWVDFYCTLRRQPTADLSALVSELGNDDQGGGEPTSDTDRDVDHETLFGKAMSALDRVVGLLVWWTTGISPSSSAKEVEQTFSKEMNGAQDHLEELVGDGRKELRDAERTIQIETRNISDFDARVRQVERYIWAAKGKAEEVPSLARTAERKLEKTRRRIETLERSERKQVDDVWYDKDDYLRPPADLVLLVNPASEAFVSLDFLNAMSGVDVADEAGVEVPPAIVSITSERDRATKVSFPFGSWLGRMVRLGPRAERGEWGLAYGTLGHHQRHLTHKVTDGEKEGSPTFTVGYNQYSIESNERRTEENGRSKDDSRPPDYWVLSVPREVIANHRHIFCADGDVDDCANGANPRKPLLGIVEGLIKHWQLFEPLCAKDGRGKKECE